MVYALTTDQHQPAETEEQQVERMMEVLAVRDTARIEVPLKSPMAVQDAAMALRTLSHQLDQLAQRAQYTGQKPWITAKEMEGLVKQCSKDLLSRHKIQRRR